MSLGECTMDFDQSYAVSTWLWRWSFEALLNCKNAAEYVYVPETRKQFFQIQNIIRVLTYAFWNWKKRFISFCFKYRK